MKFDICICGGGVVGLATAYKLQLKYPKKKILVLEKEKRLASHQTGRNSGVIHSGLYYKPGSLKAKNCYNGRIQLLEFAKKNKVKLDVCGKLVVATNRREEEALPSLLSNGVKNGLDGLSILNKNQVSSIEPNIYSRAAIFVPQTGIIDFANLTNVFASKIMSINTNSKVLTSTKLLNFKNEKIVKIITTKGNFQSNILINCAGLQSDLISKKDNLKLNMKIVGFRGDYYFLKNKSLIKNLVYPVPNPEFPFLGVHFTRMIDGSFECGPNAVFTFKREGYGKFDFNFKDSCDALSFKGTWKLFFKHWRFGINEYSKAFSKRVFLKELRKILPQLKNDDIYFGRSGVRAMALGLDGNVIDDFHILEKNNVIHVINAPSPAATACLSIADSIIKLVNNKL
ncbi:MAG: L-2-hydroxyglutarate oxidase [Flavobacteriales bacterium]|nr:L-2-hydroxyglutarate oxidase [Flavobacteriales bacterium]